MHWFFKWKCGPFDKDESCSRDTHADDDEEKQVFLFVRSTIPSCLTYGACLPLLSAISRYITPLSPIHWKSSSSQLRILYIVWIHHLFLPILFHSAWPIILLFTHTQTLSAAHASKRAHIPLLNGGKGAELRGGYGRMCIYKYIEIYKVPPFLGLGLQKILNRELLGEIHMYVHIALRSRRGEKGSRIMTGRVNAVLEGGGQKTLCQFYAFN